MRVPTLARHILFAALVLAPPLAAQRTTPLGAETGRIMFSVGESFADAAGRTRIQLHARTEKPARCYAPLGARVSTRADTTIVDRWHLGDRHGICLDDASENPAGIISFP